MNILCRLGIHRPLAKTQVAFRDMVSGKQVWHARCPCGKEWLTDGNAWTGYRIARDVAQAEVDANRVQSSRTVK